MTVTTDHSTAEEVAKETKSALKKLGKSVCILSCSNDDTPHASVSTAICNVSDDPPSLLVCLEKTSSMAALLSEEARFAVNVLGADQQDIVEHCMSSSGQERFSVGDWQSTEEELPLLRGSQAIFCCRVDERHSFETHHIIIARIAESHCSQQTSGLIYLGGEFHGIG